MLMSYGVSEQTKWMMPQSYLTGIKVIGCSSYSFYVNFDHISINFCSVANPPSALPTVATCMDDLDNHASVHGGSSGDANVSKEVPANLKHLPPSGQFCQTVETLETGAEMTRHEANIDDDRCEEEEARDISAREAAMPADQHVVSGACIPFDDLMLRLQNDPRVALYDGVETDYDDIDWDLDLGQYGAELIRPLSQGSVAFHLEETTGEADNQTRAVWGSTFASRLLSDAQFSPAGEIQTQVCQEHQTLARSSKTVAARARALHCHRQTSKSKISEPAATEPAKASSYQTHGRARKSKTSSLSCHKSTNAVHVAVLHNDKPCVTRKQSGKRPSKLVLPFQSKVKKGAKKTAAETLDRKEEAAKMKAAEAEARKKAAAAKKGARKLAAAMKRADGKEAKKKASAEKKTPSTAKTIKENFGFDIFRA
nr:uncharacterized protein LOC120965050 [Aegilops tauschii subsp. strangulata]